MLKKSDERIPAGKDDGMTIRNPFKKKPEKKIAVPVRPAPTLRTYGDPAPVVTNPLLYAPPPAEPDDCGTSSSSGHHSGHASPSHGHSSSHGGHSYDSGGHSSHTSHDSGSHSFGGHDSGLSGCDSGGGF